MEHLKTFNELSSDKSINKVDSDYIDENAIPVENYKGVLQFICSNIDRSLKLATYLKDKLTKIFGKHNTRYRGEFFYYVWIVEFEGEIFQIFTANGKGTIFSIVGKRSDNKSRVCINFLTKMEELLDTESVNEISSAISRRKGGIMSKKHRKGIMREVNRLIRNEVKDFNKLSEAEKIVTQDKYIDKVCKEHGWTLHDFYFAETKELDSLSNE